MGSERSEVSVILVVDDGADQIGWQQVGGKLDAPKLQVEHLAQRAHQKRLAQPGHAFDQHVPAREQGDYGGQFCSAIARDNVLACQFHPEKSQHAGARVIGHFLGDISWS